MSQSYGSIDDKKSDSEQIASSHPVDLPNSDVLPPGLLDTKQLNRRVLKNLFVLSVALLLVFTAQNCISNLQSTIHPEDGTMSLAVMFVGRTISSFVLASWLLRKLTAKWSIILGVLGYSCYNAVHFYPRPYTLLPTAFLMGLTAAPLWTAVGSYINKLGYDYAYRMGKDVGVVQSQMFGVFFAFNQLSFVTESIINAAVFWGYEAMNGTASTDPLAKVCGVSFCPDMEQSGNHSIFLTTSTQGVPEHVVLISCVVLSLNAAGAAAVILLLDPIDRYECSGEENDCRSETSSKESSSGCSRLLPITSDLIFLAPLPVWAGYLQGFIFSDYSQAYINCSMGVQMLGPVMVVFGSFATIGALVLGPLVQRFGQTPILAAGGASCAGFIVLMFVWTTRPNLSPMLFVGAALVGWTDAVGQSQVRALYGSTFQEQPIESSSTLIFLESIGFFLNFVLHSEVCNLTQTALLITLLALAMTGMASRIFWEKRQRSPIPSLTSFTSKHTPQNPK